MARTYSITRALGADCEPIGWDIIADGEWGNRYATLNAALDAFAVTVYRGARGPEGGRPAWAFTAHTDQGIVTNDGYGTRRDAIAAALRAVALRENAGS